MSLSRSNSKIPTVIGTPVNYQSDSSDYDEKSIQEKNRQETCAAFFKTKFCE